MARPQMVNTIQRILNEREQAVIADKQAQQTIVSATKVSGMPAPPSAQIMSGVVQQQQNQVSMQQQINKNLQAILQQKYYKPADTLRAQHEQYAAQEAQIQEMIKAKQKEQEYAMIAPKETIQDSESSNYVSQEQLAMLEQLYMGMPTKKKYNLKKLGPMLQYYTPMQDYQGGFMDPNADKPTRPLGKETTSLTRF